MSEQAFEPNPASTPASTPQLTHVDSRGAARMVDVSAKEVTVRTATASGTSTATADWRGVARVDGAPVTITTTRDDATVTVAGLPADVEVRIVDASGYAVDRPIRRL